LALLLVGSFAHADAPRTGTSNVRATAAFVGVPHLVYVNRCVGGCTIHGGALEDDARTHTSKIPPKPTDYILSEFPHDDADWNAIVSCLKDVWSPYDIEITETQPALTESAWGEAIIAGSPGQIGVPEEFGGFAPLDELCRSLNFPISFTFANVFTGPDRIDLICAVASQEIAHTYGLDHSYEFLDGSSSCSDPMTYRFDCGGQKFFRNNIAKCGEDQERGCRCGPTQNSHLLLFGRIGAGTPTTTTTVSITSPLDGATISDRSMILAPAFGQRGITRVAIRLNTYLWETLPGAPFGPDGQPETEYRYTLPADVPDGIIDIEVEVRDDLDTISVARVTVTKGEPCVTADTCAVGQYCDAGRCIWDPPAGAVGDACEYPQFCIGERCDTHDGQSFCTQSCLEGLDSCPAGTECVLDGGGNYCWPVSDSGCCSSSRRMPWTSLLLALGVVVLAMRRRR
jgi:hypothetical protein